MNNDQRKQEKKKTIALKKARQQKRSWVPNE